MNLQKQPPIVSKKIRDSARGEKCQIRIPGVCNHDPETTVYAHYRYPGLGRNIKNDLEGAYACSACHDAVDGRSNVDHVFSFDPESNTYLELHHLEGCIRTRQILFNKGLIKVEK